ncbi:MAG TPA: sugar transferase [Candidatus Saccharimonadales bacterium]|nr:sugar transferase [Candidatus Saccharimonadales bacterium]
MKNNPLLIYRLILIIGDFMALVAAFTVAYTLRVKYDARPLIEEVPAETYQYAILLVLPLWIIVHGAIGLYSKSVIEHRFSELGKLVLGSFLGILVVLGYDFVEEADTLFPARLVVVYGLFLGLGFLIVFRTLARLIRQVLFKYDIGVTNLLIVGGKRSVKNTLPQFIDTKNTGYRVIGIVGPAQEDYDEIPAFPSIASASKELNGRKVQSIVQTELYSDEDKNSALLAFAQQNHLEYRFIPANSDLYSGNIEVELFREIPVITVHQTALIGWGRVIKRLFDLIFGSLFLVITSPLLLLSAILLKIAYPSESIFFKQTRLTQFNRKFTVYKFRTQHQKFDGTTPEEAFEMIGRKDLVKKYRDNGDYVEKDPRVTKIGNILRISSIDELPQLINVIKGDISLVGPRALVPHELEKYPSKHHILSVKSGMTGLAQVSGRLNISFEERRRLDLYYVQNWSFFLDATILIKTIRAVLSGSGAK